MRHETAKELQTSDITNWYYKTISKMSEDEIDAGNITACSTTDVLHKILSEARGLTNLNDCVLQELRILQEVYKERDPSNTFTNGGFLQYLTAYPFKVHLYLDEQLQHYLYKHKMGLLIYYMPFSMQPS